jgi:hypothetical protein
MILTTGTPGSKPRGREAAVPDWIFSGRMTINMKIYCNIYLLLSDTLIW